MVKTYNIPGIMNKNMFQRYYAYSRQPTCLMEFRCNFYAWLTLVETFQSFVPQ